MATDEDLAPVRSTRSMPLVFGAGAVVGVLGGTIGLGGAEFRLPLLISLFGFAALSAVILNKAMSMVVVLAALPARLAAVPASEVAAHWSVAINLLAGSLLGAWAGASWAVRMRSPTLYKVLAALMVLMAAALLVTHTTTLGTVELPLWAQVPCGVVAGFGIGVVAAIMGVAGGELLIPTIVLLFAVLRQSREDAEREHRSQAVRVTLWTEDPGANDMRLHIMNRSPDPATGVSIGLYVQKGEWGDESVEEPGRYGGPVHGPAEFAAMQRNDR